jgi:glycosyltransferase involved in cell wall biosynthesis
MKTLLIVTTGLKQIEREELLRLEALDEFPLVSLFEITLNCDIVNERFLQKIPKWRKLLYKYFPSYFAQVLEAYVNRKKYDAVISWSERRSFLFALLLKLTRSSTKHIALFYWISKPKQSFLLRFVHSHMNRIIIWSTAQYNHAITKLHLPSYKVVYIPYGVDHKFWRPTHMEQNMICSVGEEMRDYGTLIEAMKGLDIQCHIVAEKIRIIGQYLTDSKMINSYGPFPQNVKASRMNYKDLRTLYSKSKFVVLPLLESETSSGLTVLLEAMSMGKAVVCSRIKGQVDVIEDGKTGIFVPPGDVDALRRAIQHLWDHPEIAEQMGNEARRYIERNHTLEQFVNSIKSVVEEVTGKQFERTYTRTENSGLTINKEVVNENN